MFSRLKQSRLIVLGFISDKVFSESYIVNKHCQINQQNTNYQVLLKTDNDQILQREHKTTFISSRTIEEMALADGYLSFDILNQEFIDKYNQSNIILISEFDLN